MKLDDLKLTTLSGKKVILKTNDKSNCGIGGAWVEGLGDVDPRSLNVPITGMDLLQKLGGKAKVEIDPYFYYEWFNFGWPQTAVILSKESSLMLKDYQTKEAQRRKAEAKQKAEEYNLKLAQTVPGIEELKTAYSAAYQYRVAFEAAMENEDNDGVNMPVAPQVDIAELEKAYPRAALYLKAEEYSLAENFDKSIAGKKAKEILADGGELETAQKLLDNWLDINKID